jgi:hypothetical protein
LLCCADNLPHATKPPPPAVATLGHRTPACAARPRRSLRHLIAHARAFPLAMCPKAEPFARVPPRRQALTLPPPPDCRLPDLAVAVSWLCRARSPSQHGAMRHSCRVQAAAAFPQKPLMRLPHTPPLHTHAHMPHEPDPPGILAAARNPTKTDTWALLISV